VAYRASQGDKVVAQETFASDITAMQWAHQVVWGSLPESRNPERRIVERQNQSGEWAFVEEYGRATGA